MQNIYCLGSNLWKSNATTVFWGFFEVHWVEFEQKSILSYQSMRPSLLQRILRTGGYDQPSHRPTGAQFPRRTHSENWIDTGSVLSVVTRIDNLPISETEFGQIGVGSRPGTL